MMSKLESKPNTKRNMRFLERLLWWNSLVSYLVLFHGGKMGKRHRKQPLNFFRLFWCRPYSFWGRGWGVAKWVLVFLDYLSPTPIHFEAKGWGVVKWAPQPFLDQFGINPHIFWGEEDRSRKMPPLALLGYFGADPYTFEVIGRGVTKWAPPW